jgi:DcuC family C4-dicarboxylate transporter
MSVLPGILILLVFLAAAGLMFTRRLPALLALPLMAILIGLIVGCSQPDWSWESLKAFIFGKIMVDGSKKLAGQMVATMFGAMLSQVVIRQGIAQQFIRWAAEYAGDRKMLLGLVLFAVVAFNFATLTGLGAVIMLGSLVLPILISSGFTPIYAATLVLLGISLGGLFNPVNWRFYVELLGLTEEVVQAQVLRVAGVLIAVSLFYLIIEGRRQSRVFAWAAIGIEEEAQGPRVPLLALFTPVLPPAMMLLFKWPDIPAFMFAILFGCLITQPSRVVTNVTAAVLEGLKDVGPVIGLFIGLGMTLTATMDDSAKAIMNPFLESVLPSSALGYVAFFTLLAPLALYRGPFNLYGLGAGFLVLMANAKVLPAVAIMTAFLCVGQIQSVCDPTNTANVWIGQFVQVSPEKILKHTLPYIVAFIFLALTGMVTLGGVLQ